MSTDELFNADAERMKSEPALWVPSETVFPENAGCNFKSVVSYKSVTELAAEHQNLFEYIARLEKCEKERVFQLHAFSDEIAHLKTRNRRLKAHINDAIMHLVTNIDADGNSMADSDAINCLRHAVAEEAFSFTPRSENDP